MSLVLLLKILGLIFIGFAAFGVPSRWNVHWGWLGVLLIGIAFLF